MWASIGHACSEYVAPTVESNRPVVALLVSPCSAAARANPSTRARVGAVPLITSIAGCSICVPRSSTGRSRVSAGGGVRLAGPPTSWSVTHFHEWNTLSGVSPSP